MLNRGDSKDDREYFTSVWRAVKVGTIVDVQNSIDQIRARCLFHYVDWKVTYSGNETTALELAVILNDAEKVQLLIDCGADIWTGHPQEKAQDNYEKNGDTHIQVLDIIDQAIVDLNYQSKHRGEERFE